MTVVYSLKARSQGFGMPLVGLCANLVELLLVMLILAPSLRADEFLVLPIEGQCYSFDVARREYAQRIFKDRLADNRFAKFQGLKIVSIEFARVDVFDDADPNEDNPLFRFINSMNIRTRESTLKPLLQFSEGDLLDPSSIAESERNLRARSYLAEAFVMPIASCDGEVHLLVVTQDAWTTQPIVSATREGGKNKSKYGLVEGNFWGTGSELSVVVSQEDQRRSVGYKFKKDYFLGKPLSLSFGFSDNSDGYARAFQFGKPFYTNETQSGFDIDIFQSDALISTEQNSQRLASYQVKQESSTVYAGFQQRLSAHSVTRFLSGLTSSEELYSDYFGSPSLRPVTLGPLAYPWVGFEHQSTDYVVMKNINFIEMTEDLRVGGTWQASIGYSPESDGARSALLANAAYRRLFVMSDSLFLFATSYSAAAYESSARQPKDTYYHATAILDYLWLIDERQRIASVFTYGKAAIAAVHKALSLGGEQLVRGYPSNYVLGNKVVGGTLEYRYHSDIHFLNVIRVGWAGYIDVATLQNTQFAVSNQGYAGELLSNIGLGLRITSSKTHVGNMVHIDFAVPTGYKKNTDRYQILLRAEQHF